MFGPIGSEGSDQVVQLSDSRLSRRRRSVEHQYILERKVDLVYKLTCQVQVNSEGKILSFLVRKT